MKYLVTGAAGQLGYEFAQLLGHDHLLVGRKQLDITNVSEVQSFICRERPAVVINCAAYTHVDRAEHEPVACQSVNADAVAHLAAACDQVDALLVQISTDYVFGQPVLGSPTVPQGQVDPRPYRESDQPNPLNVYGHTKHQGEINAAQAGRHLIVRSGGLYGSSPGCSNFITAMLNGFQVGQPIRVVGDQVCSPTSAKHLAEAVLKLVAIDSSGVYHVTNTGATTWYDFAVEIFRICRLDADIAKCTAAEYNAPAIRPAYAVLSTARYEQAVGQPLARWDAALAEHLQRILPKRLASLTSVRTSAPTHS